MLSGKVNLFHTSASHFPQTEVSTVNANALKPAYSTQLKISWFIFRYHKG